MNGNKEKETRNNLLPLQVYEMYSLSSNSAYKDTADLSELTGQFHIIHEFE